MSFGVLFVCTGNICRSPMAERVLMARLADGTGISAASAGTGALVGHEMDAQAAAVTRDLGADPTGHEGLSVTVDLAGAAGLVLTATTAHRDDVLALQPRALRRTFTMREFVRLARTVEPLPPMLRRPEDDYVARVAEIAAQRGHVPPPRPGEDDIGDPFGGPFEGMQACGRRISATVDSTLLALGLLPQS